MHLAQPCGEAEVGVDLPDREAGVRPDRVDVLAHRRGVRERAWRQLVVGPVIDDQDPGDLRRAHFVAVTYRSEPATRATLPRKRVARDCTSVRPRNAEHEVVEVLTPDAGRRENPLNIRRTSAADENSVAGAAAPSAFAS